jgi:hypothetical protein
MGRKTQEIDTRFLMLDRLAQESCSSPEVLIPWAAHTPITAEHRIKNRHLDLSQTNTTPHPTEAPPTLASAKSFSSAKLLIRIESTPPLHMFVLALASFAATSNTIQWDPLV